MRIALYNPIALSSGRKTSPPVALIGIAHEARKRGAEVRIYSPDLCVARAIKQIKEFHPDVLGVGTLYGAECLSRERSVVEAFRGKIKIVVGGQDASARPNTVISLLKPDFLVRNEGELAFSELVRASFDPRKANLDVISIEERGGTFVVSPKLAYSLDDLPLPTDMPPIFPLREKWGEGTIDVARGCIGLCTFCGGSNTKLTYMSPKMVLAHIRAWKSMGNKHIDLLAPDLTSSPAKASQIIREINAAADLKGSSYFFSVRLDSMARAMDVVFEDGKKAYDEWMQF